MGGKQDRLAEELAAAIIEDEDAYLVVDEHELLYVGVEASDASAYYEGYQKGCDSASTVVYHVTAREVKV